MRFLLDTNVLSDFVRGEAGVVSRLKREASRDLAVSAITEMEVEYGLAKAPSSFSKRKRDGMRVLLNLVVVLPFEREDARAAGQLRASLAADGTPIGAYDVLLAACALRHGLRLVTHNTREFARVGGLSIEDWCNTQ